LIYRLGLKNNLWTHNKSCWCGKIFFIVSNNWAKRCTLFLL